MGTLNDYRLADWYYTDNELTKMDAELLDSRVYRYDAEPTKEHVVMYQIIGKNGDTGKVWIGKTPDLILTMDALNRVWSDIELKFIILKVSKSTYGADRLVEAMRVVLLPWKYETKSPEYAGADCIYGFEEWMTNLIRD